MPEHRTEPGTPALSHPACLHGRAAFSGIEIDVEVLGLEHLEIEGAILDFVLAEVLGLQRWAGDGERKGKNETQTQGTARSSYHMKVPPRDNAERRNWQQ